MLLFWVSINQKHVLQYSFWGRLLALGRIHLAVGHSCEPAV